MSRRIMDCMKRVFSYEMTWKEIEAMLDKVQVFIVPTGSTEQHGPHLPLQHDLASVLRVVEGASLKMHPRVLVTTPVAIGISPHHLKFPGTLSLSTETFIDIVLDICESLRHHGVKKVAIINGHGGNSPALPIIARKAMDELDLHMAYANYWDLVSSDTIDLLETGYYPGHADEFETSMALYFYPEMVRREAVRKLESRKISPDILYLLQKSAIPFDFDLFSEWGLTLARQGPYTGQLGQPQLATKEKGEKIFKSAVDGLCTFLEHFIAAEFPR